MTSDALRHLRQATDAAISDRTIVEAIRVMSAAPSPRGRERATATRLAAWARDRWPRLPWNLEAVGPEGTNLTSTAGGSGPELLVYSHLDTSLSGDAAHDRWATGLDGPVAPPTLDPVSGLLSGFGLGVARAPAAAALMGYAAAATALRREGLPHRLCLLLASAGTHSSPFATARPASPSPSAASGVSGVSGEPSGIDEYLRSHPLPAAAVVAKCGPPGVLYEEPGAIFLRVRLDGAYRPVLARGADGGLLAGLGAVVAILESWRAEHLAARTAPGRQLAAEAGIGAVRGGLAEKPDLLPGLVELHLYLTTVPGDDPGEIARTVLERLRAGIRGGPLERHRVSVDAHMVHPAGSTPPGAPVIRQAIAAWDDEHGAPPPPISGWKGSTDGVVLRGHGIPTARVGPAAASDPADPRRDVFDPQELARFARLYAGIALRHALGVPGTRSGRGT
ncbi:hypothetical protein ACIBCT_00840 [Streptosporangium sp. NPDC050855]|uniref:hypothetical protein n=1 Tax=Streptosporangium sp. NPDC050855 TaxID=3366194 RepID=UPI0037B58548